MKYIVKFSVIAVFQMMALQVFADNLNLSNISKLSAHYLEEKSAFCYSQDSLSQYLDAAKTSNIQVMNELVLAGKCNFVPDGQVYQVGKFDDAKIGGTPVIAFNKDDTTLWTFRAFVNSVNFDVAMP